MYQIRSWREYKSLGLFASALICLLLTAACVLKSNDPRVQLRESAFTGDLAGTKRALAAGAPVDAVGPDGKTPLMGACYFNFGAKEGHLKVIEYLVDAGADVNMPDHSGNTPLIAAVNSYPQVTPLLLAAGADVNHHGGSGWTPLMYAAKGGHIEAIHQLLKAGARIEDTNKDGETVIDIARRFGQNEAAEVIRQRTY